MASEITDFDFVLYSGCVRRGVYLPSTVAVRTQVAWNGHRATGDVRRTTEEQALGRHSFSDLAGSKTSDAERLPEAQRDVTMLVIFWDPEHKVLTCVYSGCAVRL